MKPDAITLGKVIAGGILTGAYDLLSEKFGKLTLVTAPEHYADVCSVGGTLVAKVFAMAVIKAIPRKVLTEKNTKF